MTELREHSAGPHRTSRSRWAAIGAAVAVSLGAGGGFGTARATVDSGERTVYVAIEPCRLVDTRPAATLTVSSRSTPLGAAEEALFDAHGANGDCSIPPTAVAIATNMTALGASEVTFLTVWEAGLSKPNASSLNPAPGQPPTPNQVTVPLSGAGQFEVFNNAGTVGLLVDVIGYYEHHNHDDRYYSKAAIDSMNEATLERTVIIGALEFRPALPSGVWALETGQIYVPSGASNKSLYASLDLPTGSTITTMRLRAHDNVFLNLALELQSKNDLDVVSTQLEAVTSGEVDTLRDSFATGSVSVSRNAYLYLQLTAGVGSGFDWGTADSALRVAFVEIEYTLPA